MAIWRYMTDKELRRRTCWILFLINCAWHKWSDYQSIGETGSVNITPCCFTRRNRVLWIISWCFASCLAIHQWMWISTAAEHGLPTHFATNLNLPRLMMDCCCLAKRQCTVFVRWRLKVVNFGIKTTISVSVI